MERNKSTCLEYILASVRKSLEYSLEEELKENNNGETCDDIIEALELCYKLLHYEYFKTSSDSVEHVDVKHINRWLDKWRHLYNRDLRAKKRDLRRLFNLIIENAEDWI